MKVKNSQTKNLLRYLALGSGILALSMLSPMLPQKLLEAYLRKKRFQRYLFLKDLRRLQSRALIDYREEPDGTIKIALTRRGKQEILRYKLEDLAIRKPKRWDRKWRLVIFDIPHEYRRARDALRQKLKAMGFYPLQKSVFVHPFPCEDEIDFLCEIFNVRRYVLILTVDHFEGSDKLAHHFGLLSQ